VIRSSGPLVRGALFGIGLLAVVLALGPGRPEAAPPEDKTIPLEKYTSEKARQLAQKYVDDLRALYTGIYHCVPWVEVEKESVGFQRPKFLSGGDQRYLSIRIFIEQETSAAFDSLAFHDRASAMYSRYVGPMLQRMTRSRALTSDPGLDGFTIILEWRKQSGARGGRPVHETIAVFLEKDPAMRHLAGQLTARQLADRAKILGWDGETSVGQVQVTLYKDDFVATYKVANYQPEPGVSCP
jgi:hypothetical protein